MHKILSEKVVFDDKLVIEKAELNDGKNTFSRLRLNRQDASVVLVFNTETQKIVLTKQFRYAISSKVKEPIYEIVAGKIDQDEKPLNAAIRETEEETGYKVQEANIRLLTSCFSSPGYSSEMFHVYYATVTNANKVSKGGGMEKENESIEVVEMMLEDFQNLIRSGKILDAKTYVAGLLLNNL